MYIFNFLEELSKNNNKEWFDSHQELFLLAKEEATHIFNEIYNRVAAQDYVSDMKIYRIYRDLRFSKDKTPYKTHFGLYFQRKQPQYRGGYYVHLGINECFVGGGFFNPNKEDLLRIRQEIAAEADAFKAVMESEELSKGRIIDYKAFNFVDGEGVRNSLYVAGCMFHCEGCYNVATWSFNAGIPYTAELEEQIMEDLAQPYVQGLTLLGGEPFLNTGILLPLVKRIRKELPDKDIWSWTGYTWEEMMLETPDKLELLSLIDILVDGRYDKSKRNLMLQFRGSSNQRIIDVQKSLKSGQIVIWDKLNDGKETYEQVKRE